MIIATEGNSHTMTDAIIEALAAAVDLLAIAIFIAGVVTVAAILTGAA